MLGMVCVNAVNRPYRDNSEVVRNLRRDGVKFFLVSLLLSSRSKYRSVLWKIGTSVHENGQSFRCDLHFGEYARVSSPLPPPRKC